jgi:hypothetical protein
MFIDDCRLYDELEMTNREDGIAVGPPALRRNLASGNMSNCEYVLTGSR